MLICLISKKEKIQAFLFIHAHNLKQFFFQMAEAKKQKTKKIYIVKYPIAPKWFLVVPYYFVLMLLLYLELKTLG